MAAASTITNLLSVNFIIAATFKDCSNSYPESISSLTFKLFTWYSQYKCPYMSVSDPCSVSSYGQKMFSCLPPFATIFVRLPMLSCFERKQWPPPYQIDDTDLQKYLVSLVELKPCSCWEMLQIAILVRATSDLCHMAFMLQRTEQEAIIVLYLRTLHKLGVCCLLPDPNGYHRPNNYSLQFGAPWLLTTCATPFGCVYVSWEIAWLPMVSPCAYSDLGSGEILISRYKLNGSREELNSALSLLVLVCCVSVQSASDDLKFQFATILYLSIQPAQPLEKFTCGILVAHLILLGVLLIGVLIVWPHFSKVQIIEYSTEMSSWIDAISKVDQAICSELGYSWHSSQLELVIDGFLHTFVSRNLIGHIFECGSGLIQLNIGWLFGQPLLENLFQFSPTEKPFLSDSEQLQWKIAWSVGLTCPDVDQESSAITLRFFMPQGTNLQFHQEHSYVVCYLATEANFFQSRPRCYLERSSFTLHHMSVLHFLWDPGGSTRRRLEGKPKFKGGGLSAIPPVTYIWAGWWAISIGQGLLTT